LKLITISLGSGARLENMDAPCPVAPYKMQYALNTDYGLFIETKFHGTLSTVAVI
jgi:hypothetical protein